MTKQQLEAVIEAAMRTTTPLPRQQTIITASLATKDTVNFLVVGYVKNANTILQALKNPKQLPHTITASKVIQQALDNHIDPDAPVTTLILVEINKHISIHTKASKDLTSLLIKVCGRWLGNTAHQEN